MTVLEKIKRCVSLVWDFQEIYGEEDIEEFCHNELSTYPQHDEIMEYFKHLAELEKENAELRKVAEFGYNKGKEEIKLLKETHRQSLKILTDQIEELHKANEWHYVKDGDLPKDDKQYLVLFSYNYKGKKEISCGVRDNLHSDFEIHRCYTEQIIAWKEIVLPKKSC